MGTPASQTRAQTGSVTLVRSLRRPLSAGVLALTLAAGIGIAAPSVGATPSAGATPTISAAAPYIAPALDWKPCRSIAQCATLIVPAFWSDPTGPTIGLNVIKVAPPRLPQAPAIVVNPGGPGAPGAEFAITMSYALPVSITSAFAIVGLDLRGTGVTGHVDCASTAQLNAYYNAPQAPHTKDEAQALIAAGRSMTQGCLTKSPVAARNSSTANSVMDLEALRGALDQESLNYIGFSYGTYLGALYANANPSRVGRFLLDGVVDPTTNLSSLSKGQLDGFTQTIRAFAADCAGRRACPLGTSTSQALRRLNAWLLELNQHPLDVGRRELNESQALLAIFGSMYSPSWDALRSAIRQAMHSDGAMMLALADSFSGRSRRYSDGVAEAFFSITCQDSWKQPTLTEIQHNAREWSAASPIPEVARSFAWSSASCLSYPSTSTKPVINGKAVPPVLILGNTTDPATPLKWARSLHSQLPNSRLVTVNVVGHTAASRGITCVDMHIENYFLDGRLPPQGALC